MLDYAKLFSDRLIILNGPSRSGTSILGKLLGSSSPAFYLYEPAFLQYPTICPDPPHLLMTLFEDHFLPIITGRSLNWNHGEETEWHQYYRDSDLLWGCRRPQVLDYIANTRPYFIIKLTDMIGTRWLALKINLTDPLKIYTIVRNGCDVVASALKRGWYTDQWLEDAITDYWTQSLSRNDLWMWEPKAASPATRASCMWRNFAHEFPKSIRYESLVRNPAGILGRVCPTDLHPTSITHWHATAMVNHQPTPHDHATILSQLDPCELPLFVSAMKEAGYDC